MTALLVTAVTLTGSATVAATLALADTARHRLSWRRRAAWCRPWPQASVAKRPQ